MTDYSSAVNSFVNVTLNASLTGAYDDTSGNVLVRVWVNTPGNCNLVINYADSNTGTDAVSESYAVYGNHVSSINSLIKKRWAMVTLLNVTPTVPQPNVLVRTKFAARAVHPYLNYSTDDITANVSIALEDFTINSSIDHSGASILNYGRTDPVDGTAISERLAHRAIRTDNCGNLTIVGATGNDASVTLSTIRPVIMGGYSLTDGKIKSISVDQSGYLNMTPNTDSVFNVSAGASGLLVTPVPTAVFNVSAGLTGLMVRPGTGALFGITGEAAGFAVKPGTGALFGITGEAAGFAVKPGTNSLFGITGEAAGFAVKPGTGATFNSSVANLRSILLDYADANMGFNYRAIAPTVNHIYSVNVFNTGVATYYVKMYLLNAFPDNNTYQTVQTNTLPYMNIAINANSQRDIVFPRGISLTNLPAPYLLLSTVHSQAVSADIPENTVHVMISYD
jgi:hypothetical protein